jgi:choline/glycine/proline betaine transport protein
MFIARVSYGRTVREFIKGVLLIPTLVTFVWMTAFGNSALNIELFGAGGIASAVQDNIPVSLFVLLENFPLDLITASLSVVVVVTFFVTSSDSGSLVIDIITAGGNPDPPKLQRIFWAVSEGAVAAALLVAGGLVALQTAAITTGLPFAVVLLGMCYALHKGMDDYRSGQTFALSNEAFEGQEFRTRATHRLPTFGRRKIWLGHSSDPAERRREDDTPSGTAAGGRQ